MMMGLLSKHDIRTGGGLTHQVELDPYTTRVCPHTLHVPPPGLSNNDSRDHHMSLRATASRCSNAFFERTFDPIRDTRWQAAGPEVLLRTVMRCWHWECPGVLASW